MATVTKWDWQASNGTATAEATIAAYNALRHGGKTAAFTYAVWNDLLDKISAQRLSWGDTAWLDIPVGLSAARMQSKQAMTADRFNAAVNNMPTTKSWPWAAELGRTAVKKGDKCKGVYFVYLTEALNHWIETAPIPFQFNSSLLVQMSSVTTLDTALRLIAEPMCIVHTGSALVRPDPSIRFSSNTHYQHSGQLSVVVFNAENIEQRLFYNLDHGVKFTLYPTDHVIISNPVNTIQAATISFGGCDFVVFTMPINTALSSIVDTSNSLGIVGGTSYAVLQALNIGTTLGMNMSGELVAEWHGELWIREFDSIPITAAVSDLLTITMPIRTPLGSHVRSSVASNLGLSVTPAALNIAGAKADLPLTLSIQPAFSVLSWNTVITDIQSATTLSATAIRAKVARTAATLGSNLSISLGIHAFRRLATASEINLTSAISASAQSPDILPYAVAIAEHVNVGANVTANAFAEFGIDLIGLLSASAVPTVAWFANTAATLGSVSDMIAAITAKAPKDVKAVIDVISGIGTKALVATDLNHISVTLDSVTESSLGIRLAGNDGSVRIQLNIESSGELTIGAISACSVSARLEIAYSGSSQMDMDTAIEFKGELHGKHTGTANFCIASYVLASELEDMLVADLDDTLVTDVEFTIHT